MLILLAIVVGIGGGASIAALAGAQRTDTAVPEFLSYALADDGGFLFGNVSSPPKSPGPADSLALAPAERKIVDLPQVAAYFRAPYLFLTPDRTGSNAARDADQINVIGDADRDLYRSVDRPLVVSGRLPDPRRPFEVAVNELAATGHHLHVGSTLRLYAYSYAQVSSGELTASSSATPIRPTGPSYLVHVTGVVRFPQDVNAVLPLIDKQGVSYESQRNLYTTPAFLQRLARGLGVPVSQVPDVNLVGVRLHRGAADWKAFDRSVSRASETAITVGSPGNVYGMRQAAASAATWHPSRRDGADRLRAARGPGHHPLRRAGARTSGPEPGRRLPRAAQPRCGPGPGGERCAPARRARRRRRGRPRRGHRVRSFADHARRAGANRRRSTPGSTPMSPTCALAS